MMQLLFLFAGFIGMYFFAQVMTPLMVIDYVRNRKNDQKRNLVLTKDEVYEALKSRVHFNKSGDFCVYEEDLAYLSGVPRKQIAKIRAMYCHHVPADMTVVQGDDHLPLSELDILLKYLYPG